MLKELISASFWENLVVSLIRWSIDVVPILILVLFLYLLTKRMLRFTIDKIHVRLKAKYEKEAKLEEGKRINTLIGIVKGTLNIAMAVIFALIFLEELGIDIAPLLAGAGIIGLAVGFGAQELVRDYISGFFMLLENQLRVGDIVRINDTPGVVEAIELRTITLRDLSGTVHIFQNGKIQSLSNMTKEWSGAVFDIGVAYKENADHVISVMKEVAEDLGGSVDYKDLMLEPMEVFGLDNFGDSAIVIKARIKAVPGKQWFVGREYRKRLKAAFDKVGIEIPFPHRTIYWGENSNPFKLGMDSEKIKNDK
jgi:small conductance mechanosensitive channel